MSISPTPFPLSETVTAEMEIFFLILANPKMTASKTSIVHFGGDATKQQKTADEKSCFSRHVWKKKQKKTF